MNSRSFDRSDAQVAEAIEMSGGDAAQGSGAAGTTRSEAVTTAVEHLVDE
ncbi:MAG: hypothetical protein JNK85_13130, partial [Verrucomicrobiales bacterium]|nr:hypothetical protein [Verrucomicrobiales bacterium]